jgi:hypothetical protein
MNDPESAFRLISTELAMRRAPALKRAAHAWDAELSDNFPPPLRGRVGVGGQGDCCASGDYDHAA